MKQTDIESGEAIISEFMGKAMSFYNNYELLMAVVEKVEETEELGGICTIIQGKCTISARHLGDHTIYANVDNYFTMGAKGKCSAIFEALTIYMNTRKKLLNLSK